MRKEFVFSANGYSDYQKNFATEKTVREAPLDPDSFYNPWNPDDLIQKNQDYSIYEDMLKDDQVSAAVSLKKDLIIGSGFDFVCQDSDQEDIKADLERAFKEDPEYPFEEMIEEMASHLDFGFSITEKVFKKRPEDGSIGLKYLRNRHPGPWLLHQDVYGNVIRYEQQGTTTSVDVPAEVLIHMIHKRRFQNPYGCADLRSAYQAWFAKKHITRWYSIFIEKSASPIPHGKYGVQATPAARQELYDSLKRFQTKSTLVTPDFMHVDFLEPSSNGEAFIKGINLFNMFIARSLLIPDLIGIGGTETGGGSYSLGENQMRIFFKHLGRIRKTIEQTINKHLVAPIVSYNHGIVDDYPKFQFRPIDEQDLVEAARIWLDAVKSRAWRPTSAQVNHFHDLINFPAFSDDDFDDEPQRGEENPAVEEDQDDPDEASEDGEIREVQISETSDTDNEVEASSDEKDDYAAAVSYTTKTDFALIKQTFDKSEQGLVDDLKPIIDDVFLAYEKDLRRKNVMENPRAITDIKFKGTAKIRSALNKAFKGTYSEGRQIAASELGETKEDFAKPIVDKEFLKLLDDENYYFIADWEFKMSQAARVAVIQAIKDGNSISQAILSVKNGMLASSTASIERYSRTKFTEVMNKGRVDYFEKSNAIHGYRYNAILDDRTTDICRELDGKTFAAGDEPIPPLHWNCRSVLEAIPITQDFTPDKKVGNKPINQFIEGELQKTKFPKQ